MFDKLCGRAGTVQVFQPCRFVSRRDLSSQVLTSVDINGGSTARFTLLDYVGIGDLPASWGLSQAGFHWLSIMVTCDWFQAAREGGGGRQLQRRV